MKSLFAVSSGSYSDYSVKAVFEDEATAKAWVESMNASDGYHDNFVEKFTFIPAGTLPYKLTTYSQSVELHDDGRIEIRPMNVNVDWAIGSYHGVPPQRPAVRYVRAPCHKDKGGRLEVRGADEQAVLQVISDRICQWKAGAWAGRKFEEINEGGDE